MQLIYIDYIAILALLASCTWIAFTGTRRCTVYNDVSYASCAEMPSDQDSCKTCRYQQIVSYVVGTLIILVSIVTLLVALYRKPENFAFVQQRAKNAYMQALKLKYNRSR